MLKSIFVLFSCIIVIYIMYKTRKQKRIELSKTTLSDDLRNAIEHNNFTGLFYKKIRIKKLTDDVFFFKCMKPSACDDIVEIIKKYETETSSSNRRQPNSMNKYGLVLNEINGVRRICDHFQKKIIQPIARKLFAYALNNRSLDGHHTFTVRYKKGEDRGLDMHTDDSDITFNICLKAASGGSELQFCGDISEPTHRKESIRFVHKKGYAVMHYGSRRHGALDIDKGERINIIMWSYCNPRLDRALRPAENADPDPVCLSWTHDLDYHKQMRKNKKEIPYHKRTMSQTAWLLPDP